MTRISHALNRVLGLARNVPIPERIGEKAKNACLSALPAVIWISIGFAVLGPISDRMVETAKTQTYGTTYYEAKRLVRSVQYADTVPDMKAGATKLADWLALEGTDYVTVKKTDLEGSYAVRRAEADIRAAVAGSGEDRNEQGYQAYRIRKSAAETPTDSFRRDAVSPGTWLINHMLAYLLAGWLGFGLHAWIRCVQQNKTGLSRAASVIDSAFKATIPAGAIGFVTGILVLAMLA